MGTDARTVLSNVLATAGVPLDDSEPWGVRVHDDRLWQRVLSRQNLGLGEAYLDGWWDCDRIDELFARVLSADLDGLLRPTPALVWHAARAWLGSQQLRAGAARNARAHYDIGNDLYAAMLDARMIYSCAYWRDATDLGGAQEAKLELVCRKLGLQPGMRVVDIGCGWGGFLQYAAQHYGVVGVGISPAGEQIAAARQRCAGLPVTFRQAEYRDLPVLLGEPADRIVSIGMLEHVGPRHYRRFFDCCDRVLADGGRMLHHTIGSTSSTQHGDAFMDRYIFPGGVIPSLAQLTHAAAPRFVVDDVQNIGPDYDPTLLAWHANIEAAWPDRYDERFRRMWRYYLLSCAGVFRVRGLHVWQLVVRREGRAPRYDRPL